LNQYRHCLPEKYEWIERHLGSDFVSRMIVSKDKTMIHGDILIDDNPKVLGLGPASWKHVIFDQPYNRHVGGPRMTWKNWREILFP
jgi:5'-nucleotidase